MTRAERRREVIKNRIALGAILIEFIIIIVLLVFVVKRLAGDNDGETSKNPGTTVENTVAGANGQGTGSGLLTVDSDTIDREASDALSSMSAGQTGVASGNLSADSDEATWTPDIVGTLDGKNDGNGENEGQQTADSENASEGEEQKQDDINAEETETENGRPAATGELADVIREADLHSAMYDYDAAIELVKSYEGYETQEAATAAIAQYEELKGKLVEWPNNTEISHLFVHSLIVDTDRAFGPKSSKPQGYNQYMTTVSEFNKILDQMYEKGYVLVSIHDIAKVVTEADGSQHLKRQSIMLPEGKKPFVLSEDDVNYYEYMDNDGFADKIVIGEDGRPTCQYTDVDGTVYFGEYDMLPIVDRFVDEHPDFSYHGAKGILALTGYEGALGYDTGLSMKIYDGLDEETKMAKINAEREKAKAVADAIKADGWEFASHSYTHSNMTNASLDHLKYDTKRWHDEVEPITGPTDIYIYPYGADICDWRGYSGAKYEHLKANGFWYFCNVDGAQYWIQIKDAYMRMGRINADGERMNVSPERLSYFFDVDTVYDPARPAFK